MIDTEPAQPGGVGGGDGFDGAGAQPASLYLPTRLRSIAGLCPREASQALADAVREVSGPDLADDPTLLILDWHGGRSADRYTSAGANQTRASTALPD
ncbi:hypothetical protein NKG94_51660 [Micromonospora sp. M12]